MRTEDNEGVKRRETNAYIVRCGKETRAGAKNIRGERRTNDGCGERKRGRRGKKDGHFKKTELSIYQWTIKLIARHHANVQDRVSFLGRRRLYKNRRVPPLSLFFPRARFFTRIRAGVLNHFRKEREREKKKRILSLSPSQRRLSYRDGSESRDNSCDRVCRHRAMQTAPLKRAKRARATYINRPRDVVLI